MRNLITLFYSSWERYIALQKIWIFWSYFLLGFSENNHLLSFTACVDLWASETFLTDRKWTGNAPIRNSTSTKWLGWRTTFTSNPSEQYRKSLQVFILFITQLFIHRMISRIFCITDTKPFRRGNQELQQRVCQAVHQVLYFLKLCPTL